MDQSCPGRRVYVGLEMELSGSICILDRDPCCGAHKGRSSIRLRKLFFREFLVRTDKKCVHNKKRVAQTVQTGHSR